MFCGARTSAFGLLVFFAPQSLIAVDILTVSDDGETQKDAVGGSATLPSLIRREGITAAMTESELREADVVLHSQERQVAPIGVESIVSAKQSESIASNGVVASVGVVSNVNAQSLENEAATIQSGVLNSDDKSVEAVRHSAIATVTIEPTNPLDISADVISVPIDDKDWLNYDEEAAPYTVKTVEKDAEGKVKEGKGAVRAEGNELKEEARYGWNTTTVWVGSGVGFSILCCVLAVCAIIVVKMRAEGKDGAAEPLAQAPLGGPQTAAEATPSVPAQS